MTASPAVRAASGLLRFGGDLTIDTQSISGGILRAEGGYGLWNTSASGASGIVDDVGAAITVVGRTTIATKGTAGIGIYNDSVSGTFDFNGPVAVTTSGGTGSITYYTCRRPAAPPPSGRGASTAAAGSPASTTPSPSRPAAHPAAAWRMHGGTATFDAALDIDTTGSAAHGIYLTTAASAARTPTLNVPGRGDGGCRLDVARSLRGIGVATFAGQTRLTAAGSGDGLRAAATSSTAGATVFNGASTISAAAPATACGRRRTGSARARSPSTRLRRSARSAAMVWEVAGGIATFAATPTISATALDAVRVSAGTFNSTAGANIANVATGAYASHILGTGVSAALARFQVAGDMRGRSGRRSPVVPGRRIDLDGRGPDGPPPPPPT